MPKYSSKQKIKCGMPLGGLGTGKMEITPYGTIDHITYQNNWTRPIENKSNKEKNRVLGIPGFHFALHVTTQAAINCKLLQTEKIKNYNTVTGIDFLGNFPFARLNYEDKNLPVEIYLNSYSFLIPGDTKNSSLPAAVFEFEVSNRLDKEVEAGLLFIARNLISKNSVGRFNVLRREKGITGLQFLHQKPLAEDTTAGEVFMCLPQDAGEISYLGEWNMQRDNFTLESNIGLDAFEYFEKEGRLPNINKKIPAQSQSVETAGALAVRFKLKPYQRKTVPFIYTWYFPRHFPGHFYEKTFKNSREVAFYVNANRDVLKTKTIQLPQILSEMGIEEWLSEALMNNLYPLFSSSWLTKSGDFTMYEAPLVCPLMGTLDVYFYASVAVGLLFPELDKRNLLLFKRQMRKSGYVPHDIGFERMDLPSNGTTIPLWKDLNPKLILLSYKAYLAAKDMKFLKEMYPALKRALEFSIALDKDADGLPDNEGFDTTFDTWGFKGANSYTSGVYLTALLALKNMADVLKDKKTALKCVNHFIKGKKSFGEKLWNGKFYITARGKDWDYDSCMVAQLAGQWYAYLLGLGRIFPQENIKSAIKWIIKLNVSDSKFGATNAVFASGKRDMESYHSQNIWPGVCYSFAALAIYEGFVKEGLSLTKKVWNTISAKNKSPWNQPDVIISKDGSFGFGDYYMRNLVIWSVLAALATRDEKVARGMEKIKQSTKMIRS